MATSPYSNYLDLLGSWPTGIALASQWLVYFDFTSVNALKSKLQDKLVNREPGSGWSLNETVTKTLLDGKYQYSTNIMSGCVFARQVVLPSENLNGGNDGLTYGGFQAPATLNNREKYSSLTVTFLETNASFLDLIIRPWLITVGYNGLIARPTNSESYVKCNFADVVMYAKTGSYRKMGIRKVYRFYNLAPVSIQGETYSYAEEGLKYSDVKFIYDRYGVLDQDTGSLISLP